LSEEKIIYAKEWRKLTIIEILKSLDIAVRVLNDKLALREEERVISEDFEDFKVLSDEEKALILEIAKDLLNLLNIPCFCF